MLRPDCVDVEKTPAFSKPKTRELFHEIIAKPEQRIESFDSVAATCTDKPSTENYRGELLINSRLQDGQQMRHSDDSC